MLSVWSTSASPTIPGARPFKCGISKLVTRRINCSHEPGLGNGTSLKNDDRVWRATGILLGSAALCLVSGLAGIEGIAIAAEKNGARKESLLSRMPEFERKLKQSQGRTKVPAQKLRQKVREKRLEGALAKIEEEPGNVVAHKALLRLRMERGEIREAIQVLDKLIELEPGDVEFKFMKARSYQIVGDRENARKEFQKLVEMLPFSAKALQGLVLCMPNREDDSVLDVVKNAAQNAAEKGQVQAARDFKMLLGQLLAMREKFNEALEQYEELIKDDPLDHRPYICQGLMYDLMGKDDEAMKCYSNYRRLCPGDNLPKRKYLDDMLIEGSLRNRLKEEGKEDYTQMQKPSVLTDEDYTSLLPQAREDEEP